MILNSENPIKNIKLFPTDCNLDCKYYSEYDLSIDDIVCCCNLLGIEIDACDTALSILPICPL